MVLVSMYPKSGWFGDLYVGIVRYKNEEQIPAEIFTDYEKLSDKELQALMRTAVGENNVDYAVIEVPAYSFAFRPVNKPLNDLFNLYLGLFHRDGEKVIIDCFEFETNGKAAYIDLYGRENVVIDPQGLKNHPEVAPAYVTAKLFAHKAYRDRLYGQRIEIYEKDCSLLDRLPVEELVRLPVRLQPARKYLNTKDPDKAEALTRAYEKFIERLKRSGEFKDHILLGLRAWV